MSLPISNAEHIYRSLRRSIIHGELAPGERLLIRAISEQFGTSSSPVIEAIRRLEQEGLAISRHNVGAQVQEWTSQDVARSFLIREINDGLAARLFVECATDAQRDKLVQLNDNFHLAARGQNTVLVREADTAYHLHIISCTLPLPMQKAMETTYAITMTYFNKTPDMLQMFLEDVHDEMTDLLLGNDPIAVEKYVHASIRQALQQSVEAGTIEPKDVLSYFASEILA